MTQQDLPFLPKWVGLVVSLVVCCGLGLFVGLILDPHGRVGAVIGLLLGLPVAGFLYTWHLASRKERQSGKRGPAMWAGEICSILAIAFCMLAMILRGCH